MSTSAYSIDLSEFDPLIGKLEAIADAMEMKPLMLGIDALLKTQTKEKFEREAGPDGPWAPLSPKTLARRRQGSAARRKVLGDSARIGGSFGAKTLRDTGAMFNSILSRNPLIEVTAQTGTAEVGTNLLRSLYNNLGTSRGIPPRVHLGFSGADKSAIQAHVEAFYAGALARGAAK